MQEYNEAEVARSGRKTRSSAGPLMAAGRNFADDDIHEYGSPGADDDEAEDVIDEDDDEVCGLIGCIRIVVRWPVCVYTRGRISQEQNTRIALSA